MANGDCIAENLKMLHYNKKLDQHQSYINTIIIGVFPFNTIFGLE